MQPLDLYATIEEYLEFQDEIDELYKAIALRVIPHQPQTLIDIGCGQGEFCHIMELNGIKTFGVDLSSKQIEIAKSKGLDVECIDIKDIKKKFDCATAVFDVINYIPPKDLEEFFIYTNKLLVDGGYFIFDINSLYGFEDIAQGTLSIDLEDKFISIDAIFEDDSLYTKITLFEQQDKLYKKYQSTIQQYYHSCEDITASLEKANFKVENIVKFNLHSDTIEDKYIVIAFKN